MNEKAMGLHTYMRRAVVLLLDAALVALGIYLAVMLRYNGHLLQWQLGRVTYFSPLMLCTYLVFLLLFGIYKISWRYADMRDMFKLLGVCLAASVINLLINRVFHLRYPRLVIGISGVITLLLLMTSRYAWIVLQDFMFTDKSQKHVRRALIVGADEQGQKLARDLRAHMPGGVRRNAVAYIDEDVEKLYRKENGVPVEGTLADVAEVVKRKRIDEVILAGEKMAAKELRGVYLRARRQNCNVMLLEPDGRLRDAQLEDALAGWTDDPLEEGAEPLLTGRSYLVNGAAGCVGAELSRQLAGLSPARLTLADHGEDALCRLRETLGTGAAYALYDACAANEADRIALNAKPDMVFHAAALTREDLADGNALKQIDTNILGAERAWQAALRAGAKAFVLISSADAYRPLTQTDASRALAERAILARSAGEMAMKTLIVRVDNMVTSENGLLRAFREKARKGEAIAVARGEARSFLSAGDAASIVLSLSALQTGGVYMIDPEDPADLMELAQIVAREMGSGAGTAAAGDDAAREPLCAQRLDAARVSRAFLARESALSPETLGNALLRAREAFRAGDETSAQAALRGLAQGDQ